MNIIIIEDYLMFRDAIVMIVKNADARWNVETAENAQEALEAFERARFAIAIIDVNLPDMFGIDLAKKIIKDYPETKTIILTMYENAMYFENAMKIGVQGYLLKRCASEELVLAIKSVYKGMPYVCSMVASPYFSPYTAPKNGGAKTDEIFARLTPREREVLKHVCAGQKAREIAKALDISPKTVDNHKMSVMNKLNVSNSVELVRYAIKAGMVEL